MNSSAPETHEVGFSDRELTEWQVRVAQRADELRSSGKPRPEDDRATWLRAEAEVFAQASADRRLRRASR